MSEHTISKIKTPSQERSKESKDRILEVALELFANNNYDKVSTRVIAQKANVNINAIKYYFGNKLSLYKTVYKKYMGPNEEEKANFRPSENLDEELEKMFSVLIIIFNKKEFHLCRKLHMREQLDPLGLWKEDIEQDIKPIHYSILKLIKKEIPHISDENANRLLFSIVSLSFGIFVNWEIIESIDPTLISNEENVIMWKNRLVLYAKAMIQVEKNNK